MKFNSKIIAVALGIAVTFCVLLPSNALGQTSQPSGTTVIHNGPPRNNVRGGQIAAGRPGTWIQHTIANHTKRQSSALHAFGGATITAAPPTSIKDAVLPQLVQIFLASINAVAAAINAAIIGATGT